MWNCPKNDRYLSHSPLKTDCQQHQLDEKGSSSTNLEVNDECVFDLVYIYAALDSLIPLARVWDFNPIILTWQNRLEFACDRHCFKTPRIQRMGTAAE